MMRFFTFFIAFLLAILPDYAPAVSYYDAADVTLEEVVDTEEEAIVQTSSHSQKRILSKPRPRSFEHRTHRQVLPQLSICRSIEKQWLVPAAGIAPDNGLIIVRKESMKRLILILLAIVLTLPAFAQVGRYKNIRVWYPGYSLKLDTATGELSAVHYDKKHCHGYSGNRIN